MEKTYLGDGVYAELERGMIKLTTENMNQDIQVVYLEPEVFNQLQKFAERVFI